MSRQSISKTVSVLGRSILAFGFVLCALQSCGSSSSDTTAVCNQLCNRVYSCTEADGGPAPAAAMTQCTEICAAEKCTNQSQLVTAANTCLAKSSCSDFIACTATAPTCQTSTTTGSGGTGAATGGTNGGGAGSNGSAGTTGSTGSGGTTGSTASCADCDKAAACCMAIATLEGSSSGSSCTALSAASCNSAGTSSVTIAMECDMVLSTGAALNLAACK